MSRLELSAFNPNLPTCSKREDKYNLLEDILLENLAKLGHNKPIAMIM
jgi:hypothetical protein